MKTTYQFAFLNYFFMDTLIPYFLTDKLVLMYEISSFTQFLISRISRSSCRSMEKYSCYDQCNDCCSKLCSVSGLGDINSKLYNVLITFQGA